MIYQPKTKSRYAAWIMDQFLCGIDFYNDKCVMATNTYYSSYSNVVDSIHIHIF